MKIILTEQQLLNMIKGKSNFDKIMDDYIDSFPEELKQNGELLKKLIKTYIQKSGYTVRFLNSCHTGFAGVRTKDQVIICKPGNNFGDFIYTIFHEMRHEKQVSEIKMPNPLTEFDLDDFEKLADQYWEMELDADQYAKNMVGQFVVKSGFPIEFAKEKFRLSHYIEQYPTMSNMIKMHLSGIVNEIKKMKSAGQEYTDIQDMPIVKKHLDKLENLL